MPTDDDLIDDNDDHPQSSPARGVGQHGGSDSSPSRVRRFEPKPADPASFAFLSGWRRHILTPEQHAKNRRTLGVIFIVIIIMAAIPVIDRLFTPRNPTINSTARALLPAPASKLPPYIVYSELGAPFTAKVGTLLPVIASTIDRFIGAPSDMQVEIAVFSDQKKFREAWLDIFGNDDSGSALGVGRESFVLFDASAVAPPGSTRLAETVTRKTENSPSAPTTTDVAASARQDNKDVTFEHLALNDELLGDLAHYIARAALEQRLGEQLRLIPEAYQDIVGEMVATTVVPSRVKAAQTDYDEVRARDVMPAPTAHNWVNDYPSNIAPNDPNARFRRDVATLLGDEFARAARGPDFVGLQVKGEDLETAFRAVTGSWQRNVRGEPNSPTNTGTSLEDVLAQLEQESMTRRRQEELRQRADGVQPPQAPTHGAAEDGG